MRVVLDTNILFSALISPHGPPDAIYRAWRLARFQLVTSHAQLDEIRRASRYPKFQSILQPARVGVMVNNMQRAIVLETLPFASIDLEQISLNTPSPHPPASGAAESSAANASNDGGSGSELTDLRVRGTNLNSWTGIA